MSPQQQRFWNEVKQLRGHIVYLCLYEIRLERLDRCVKIFLAFTSSGSIAAWAVWREFAMLWGAIIASSQFLNAIKDFLPFERRLAAVRKLSTELEGLFVQWESTWNQISEGELSDAEINTRLTDLKRAKVELVGGRLAGASLPDIQRLHAAAASLAAAYFETIYELGEVNAEEDQWQGEAEPAEAEPAEDP